MTLKELCKHFKENQNNKDMCEFYKNQYEIDNKGNYKYEELDETDIVELRPYLMCWILALYEYLANYNNKVTADWFNKYSSVTCQKEDNDYYKTFLELYMLLHSTQDTDAPSKLYDDMIEKSVPEFKRRNIAMYGLYNIA